MSVPNYVFDYLRVKNLVRSNNYHYYTLVMALVSECKYI